MPTNTDPNKRWKVAIALPRDEDLPPETVATLSQMPPINVLRMFAGAGDIFPGVIALIRGIFYTEGVDPKLREVIILRTAQLLDCTYEWVTNVVFAKNTGLTDEQIALIGTDDRVTGLGPDENLLCQATDEITKEGAISDASLDALLQRFGPQVTNKLVLMIAWFNLLSRYLLSTRVPLEDASKVAGLTSPL